MHEALLKRVQTALALAILDCNKDMTALLDDIKPALCPKPRLIAALAPLSTLRDALEVAELAWQIEASGDAGETLNGLAFNLLPKLRSLLPPGPPQQGGEGQEEDEDFRAQLKRIITPAGAAAEGAGEPVKASGLAAESNEADCVRGTFIHVRADGWAEVPAEMFGRDRRFWPVGEKFDSSGLAAESDEAAACSTTPAVTANDTTNGEPGAAA